MGLCAAGTRGVLLAVLLDPPVELLEESRKLMESAAVTDPEILETINDVYKRTDGYTLDPHSAIGVAAARATRRDPSVPMICLACAHWAKFPDANKASLGAEAAAGLVIPEPLASLHTLPTRVKMLPNDVQTVQTFVDETIA